MRFIRINSPNFLKKARKPNAIKFLIIHYTGMQSTRESIKRLLSKKHKVSCHYLIDIKGNVIQMVDDNRVAWHAGKSKWKNFKNLNENSIGIELANKGHKFGYKNFPRIQINKLVKLCFKLKRKYKIKNYYILGHSDIAPLRKLDPGEKFPWLKLKMKGLGIWHSLKNTKSTFKNFNNKKIRNIFFKNLYKIGYRYFNKKNKSKSDKLIVKSFQRRFRQNKVNGLIDLECLKISDNLAKNMKI
jgi:N-acetylmuramoyl-L-alanine amidase